MVDRLAPASAPSAEADRKGSKSDLLDQLTRGVLELTSSESWENWLRASRQFHRYSFPNQVLIIQQCPGATWVAGYRSWLRLGRQVRQGERGIRILAPCLAAVPGPAGDDDPEPALLGFRVTRVFDRSQTDGADLPEPVRILAGAGSDVEVARLSQRAVELEFGLQFTALWGTRNGDCSHALRRIRIRDDLPPAHKLKTLAHELGHAVLHGPDFQGTRALAELEAESVAYVVCRELGIDSSDYSLGYVASWSGGGPEAARLISATGSRILSGVQAILGRPDPPSGS